MTQPTTWNPGQPIRAITLWQPWASLWVYGIKKSETRSWAPNYFGPLLVHAGSHRITDDMWTPELLSASAYIGKPGLPLWYGSIIGVCFLSKFQTTDTMEPDPVERSLGDFSPGRYAWGHDGMERLPEPIPCPCAQGLWYPDRMLEKMKRRGGKQRCIRALSELLRRYE